MLKNQDYTTYILSNLTTSEQSNYFIKNFETYIKGSVSLESIVSSYPFLKEVSIEDVKISFHKLRTSIISRKKVKIYTPITISSKLIGNIHNILSEYSKSSIVLEPFQDSSIVAGIRFDLDGKIYNLTLENLKKKL